MSTEPTDEPSKNTEENLVMPELTAANLACTVLKLEGLIPMEEEEEGAPGSGYQIRYHSNHLRSLILDLHHLLEETFSGSTGLPLHDYLATLNNFCEITKELPAKDQVSKDLDVARDLYLHLCKNELVLKKQAEGEWPPPNTDLKKFVTDYLSGQIFIDKDIPAGQRENTLAVVFMPIALGSFNGIARFELENLGIIYGYMSQACTLGINGMPCFTSAHLMNRSDWERCRVAILKHCEAIKNLEV